MIGAMRLIMDDRRLQTIEQIQQFLGGNLEVEFKTLSGEEKYEWMESALKIMLSEFPFVIRGFHSDNGAVIRKHLGYVHIPQRYAKPLNAYYYEEFFNLYH